MEELCPIATSSFEYYLINLPKVRKRLEFLVDELTLNGIPVVVSDFIVSYSTIESLDYDSKGFYFVDQYGGGYELGETEKSTIQYVTELLQRELLRRLLKMTHSQWIPHYRRYADSESGQSQLLLEFRMRESGQLVDETREVVNNFV